MYIYPWNSFKYSQRNYCPEIQIGTKTISTLSYWVLLNTNALLPQVRHIIAGTAARTMAQAFIHPIDTVKTRLQVVPSSQCCHRSYFVERIL